MFTTTLHHITNAASSKLPLYTKQRPPLFYRPNAIKITLYSLRSLKENFKEVT